MSKTQIISFRINFLQVRYGSWQYGIHLRLGVSNNHSKINLLDMYGKLTYKIGIGQNPALGF